MAGLRRGLAAGAAVALLGGAWLGVWPVLVPLAYAAMAILIALIVWGLAVVETISGIPL